jgi:hypothetical protein
MKRVFTASRGLPLLGFSFLTASVGALLLRPVMGMRLFVILGATMAEEEENFLRVAGRHTASVSGWKRSVKRNTMSYCRNSAARGI